MPAYSTPISETVAAVILAGGKGERLGGTIKANETIGGVRLLERVASALGKIDGPVLVAHGQFDPALLCLDPRQIAIADAHGPFRGPLAGIAAAASWCLACENPPTLLLSVAVDTPFFPPEFLERARARLDGETGAVVAQYEGQDYPTNALWKVAALRPLLASTRDNARAPGIRDFAAGLRTLRLAWKASDSKDPFANLNTEEDRLALEKRARDQ